MSAGELAGIGCTVCGDMIADDERPVILPRAGYFMHRACLVDLIGQAEAAAASPFNFQRDRQQRRLIAESRRALLAAHDAVGQVTP